MLAAEPLGAFFGELQPGADFVDAERAFSLGHAGQPRFGFATLDLGDLDLELRLPHLLPRPLDFALQLGRVEPDQEITLADARAFGNQLDDFGLPPAERRPVRDGLRRPEHAGHGQLRGQRASAGDRRQRGVDVGMPPEGHPGEQTDGGRRDHDRDIGNLESGAGNRFHHLPDAAIIPRPHSSWQIPDCAG